MGETINNKSTTTEPPPKNGQLPKPLRGGRLNTFYWYLTFVLDFAVVKAQQLFSSEGKNKLFLYRHPDFSLSEEK